MVTDIPQEYQDELNRLNISVANAIHKREKWLDEKMVELSPLKVGDPIYDVWGGNKLGVIKELYRYWTDQNKLYDQHLSWEYKYETSPNCLDNTSRQSSIRFGSREDALKYQKMKLESLE